MPVAWYLAPYGRLPKTRWPRRYCVVDDVTPVLAAAGGTWQESEVLGNYAVVVANAPNAQLDAIDALPGVVALPRAARLVTRLATLTAAQRNALLARAEALGYSAAEISAWQAGRPDPVLFDLWELIGQRRLKPRYVDASDTIVLDGPSHPVNRIWRASGGAFPTTGILDDFNRANEGPPPSASWAGPVFPRFFGTHLKVSGNAAIANVDDYADDYWTTIFSSADGEMYQTFTTLPADTKIMYLGIRLVSPGTSGVDGYVYQVTVSNAGNEAEVLGRLDNDTLTNLGATDTSANWGNGDAQGVDTVSNAITAYRKPSGGSWASRFSRTDGTYALAGYGSIGAQGSAFVIDDAGGGPYPIPPTAMYKRDDVSRFPRRPYRQDQN